MKQSINVVDLGHSAHMTAMAAILQEVEHEGAQNHFSNAPCQVLQGDQNRKTECIYWSILKFEYTALSQEVALASLH